MKISTIINYLEELAPKSLQESYDNSGLLVGDSDADVNAALLCLDSIERVVDEAIERKCGLIIAHHPIIFSGLKSLTGKTYIEKIILKAIKNNIAIFAIHTNLDNVINGVNKKLAEKIGLQNLEILSPKEGKLEKLVFFSPTKNTEIIKEAIFNAGGGKIGKYDCCSFTINGKGSFKAGDKANPYKGVLGELHIEEEQRVEIILPTFLRSKVLQALLAAHPYEEVAYDFSKLENVWSDVGSGMIGNLPNEEEIESFLDRIKIDLGTACIRHTKLLKNKVKRIAVGGGSGSFLLNSAIVKKADILISADFKYHQFFDAEEKIVIADVGHYESEQHTPELIQEYLKEKIPNFALYLSKINTNPINYR